VREYTHSLQTTGYGLQGGRMHPNADLYPALSTAETLRI
jgi:hypothetical protein